MIMSQNIDLGELEKQLRQVVHKDGLLEIVIGFLLLVGALSSTMSEIGVSDGVRVSIYVPLMLSGTLIVVFGKRYITNPRLGLVKFGPVDKPYLWMMIAFLGVSIFMLILGAIYSELMTWSMFLFLLATFSFLAYSLDHPRFYLIGMIFASTEPIYVFCMDNPDITYAGFVAFGIPGILVISIGAVALYRFMQEYPLQEEVADGTC